MVEQHRGKAPLLHCAVYLELMADTPEELSRLQAETSADLARCGLQADRLHLCQQQGFHAAQPWGVNVFGAEYERVLPARSAANIYPLHYSGKTAPHGFPIGRDEFGVLAYIYDAVTSGELPEVAQITGIPDIRRRSFCHVLNSRAMAIRYAREHGVDYESLRLIVAHLGSGISASVHVGGQIVDSVGDDDGQFSPERSGSVPSLELIRLCFSGDYTRSDMEKKVQGRGGMYAHLGTSDCRVIERMIADGDKHADLIFQAQAYQIAKGIGLLFIVLKGQCDAIILTGGLAYSKMLTDRIVEYVGFIAPVCVMPGENEMEALALGGLRLFTVEETPRHYVLPD